MNGMSEGKIARYLTAMSGFRAQRWGINVSKAGHLGYVCTGPLWKSICQ